VIPNLAGAAERLGASASAWPIVFAGSMNGFVLLARSAARWFEDRKS
jgi:hypothetical protein